MDILLMGVLVHRPVMHKNPPPSPWGAIPGSAKTISLNFSTWFSDTLGNSSTIKLQGKIAMKTPQPFFCEILGVCSKEGSARKAFRSLRKPCVATQFCNLGHVTL